MTQPATAHFVWIVTPADQPAESAQLFLSESAEPDDAEYLKMIQSAEVFALGGRRDDKPVALKLDLTDDALTARVPADRRSAPLVVRHTLGVRERGGEPYLVKYFARTFPSSLPGTWRAVENTELLPLEIVPKQQGSNLTLQVLWQGKPAAGATVTVKSPDNAKKFEGTTDAKGNFQCPIAGAGVYSLRARHVDKTPGTHDDKAYSEVRNYTTAALTVNPTQLAPVTHDWPALPKGTTSFGAAAAGDWLYVYGGHFGDPHHYYQEGESGEFTRLNLRNPEKWESLPGGPKRTGLAMVAHNGKIYRIGGFEPKNKAEEEQSLWSHNDFARFDPDKNAWETLPALPEGRSSHDAAVVGDTLYVVGGWEHKGDTEKSQWHNTAWSIDLSADKLEWKKLPDPPFQRRALSLAGWQGKLYCIGGMQKDGGPTTATAVFDPTTNQWSEGPRLLGQTMDGFGSSAFACDGQLFVTTFSGAIQRLSPTGDRWEFVGQLAQPRFFHRLVPWQDQTLIVVGGASMEAGKIVDLERIPAADAKAPTATPGVAN